LLEDEAVRGDLDDATWGPLQAWLLRVVHRVAVGTDGMEDAAAQAVLDRAWRVLKPLVGSVGSALRAGTSSAEFTTRVESLDEDLQSPLVDRADVPHVRDALQQAARALANSHADGPTAAARLVEALELGSRHSAPPRLQPERE
jgi:hypothetical protein